VVFLATLLLSVSSAAAVDVAMPSPSSQLAPGAPPSGTVTPGATGTTAPAATVGTLLGLRPLRMGLSGPDVRQLQGILRKRGLRIVPDGAFGPGTRTAVKALQRRLRLSPSGVATLAFLRRLGVSVRTVASGASAGATAPVGTTTALAGPNAGLAHYLKAFPVRGKHTYVNDFGQPRGQGPHQGVDILSARFTPIIAVADGVIERMTRVETGLGGIWIWLRDDQGNTYYFAHMQEIAAGLEAGSRVTVGQQLGSVGNTGDARYTVTHLHFELHPGGGPAVSPYTELLLVDPTPPKH
jgi:murein DD-endopeptidase MepM/ murein hydrolase activator NlpD